LPVRAPDTVQEHRLTLGKFERAQLSKATSTERQNVWLDAIPNVAIGAASIGVGLAGYGAWKWLTDSSLIDDIATQLSNLLTGSGLIQYTAVEIGIRLNRNYLAQGQQQEIMLAAANNSELVVAEAELKRLVLEEAMLTAELDKIESGEVSGMETGFSCFYKWVTMQRPTPWACNA
jgi:hypothetical protein